MSKPTKLTRTAPERIWLQISDVTDDVRKPFPWGDGITWSDESVMPAEVEYVRIDIAERFGQAEPEGIVTVTTDESGRAIAVTRTDEEHRILSVIWEAPSAGKAEPVAKDWRHIANEWADELCNALQWVENQKEGVCSANDAVRAIRSGIERCQSLQTATPQPDRVAELERERDEWIACHARLFMKNRDLAEQVERLTKDAERYRWLARKVSAHGICDGWQFGFPTALTLPAPALAMRDPETALGQAIDAALAARADVSKVEGSV